MPRILIVDDESENREMLRLFLKDSNPNWDIFTANGETMGYECIQRQLILKQPIDVVLTDLVMADEQSGMNMLQTVRRLDPLIMSILFTAKEKSLDRYAAFEFGAFDVVEKNIRGSFAAKELNIKTRAAIQYREWSQRINFLRRYFDPKVFEVISREPEILEVKQRLITITFWDVRQFSKLCEILKNSPTLISGFLQDYCEAAAKTIFANNGLLDKFIGDGVMALFGVLNHQEDKGERDAIHAVRAAIELRKLFEEVVCIWMPKWKLYTAELIDVGLGCGIHTGEVLAGNVGTEFRDQFTALGPNVNLANRIAGRASAGQILLSQPTAERVKNEFVLSSAGVIEDIKNIPGKFALSNVEGLTEQVLLPP
ncbi:MAG: cyaB 1 [Verrucomicrobiales bacterium]|nr:cyaB 1 [Verrucomicrobiales bacterium]